MINCEMRDRNHMEFTAMFAYVLVHKLCHIAAIKMFVKTKENPAFMFRELFRLVI